jgi:hypothetical protein
MGTPPSRQPALEYECSLEAGRRLAVDHCHHSAVAAGGGSARSRHGGPHSIRRKPSADRSKRPERPPGSANRRDVKPVHRRPSTTHALNTS